MRSQFPDIGWNNFCMINKGNDTVLAQDICDPEAQQKTALPEAKDDFGWKDIYATILERDGVAVILNPTY